MKRAWAFSTALVLGLWLPTGSATAQDSLYKRLGGYDALAALTDDFLAALVGDPKFERFFIGFSDDSLGRIRQRVVELLCFSTGGPCVYTGRDMRTSHKGLGITKEEWDAAVVHLGAIMVKFNVPPELQQEVATLLGPLEQDIVDSPE